LSSLLSFVLSASSGLCLLSCSRMWLVVWCAVPRTVGGCGAVGCDCGAIPGAMPEFCVQTCVVPLPSGVCCGGSPLLVCHRLCRALIPPQWRGTWPHVACSSCVRRWLTWGLSGSHVCCSVVLGSAPASCCGFVSPPVDRDCRRWLLLVL
jgi:hypothetical protein